MVRGNEYTSTLSVSLVLFCIDDGNELYYPKVPQDGPKVNYKLPGFLAKFWELQQVMWTTNAGLTDRHTYDSRPDSWPRLRRGIVGALSPSIFDMTADGCILQNFWVKDHRQVYLIGNPWVWFLSTAAIMAYVAVRGLLILRAKRGFRDFENSKLTHL